MCIRDSSNISRAIAYLQEQDIDSVRAFLDNDPVGRQALLAIQSSGVTVEDMTALTDREHSAFEGYCESIAQQDLSLIHIFEKTNMNHKNARSALALS